MNCLYSNKECTCGYTQCNNIKECLKENQMQQRDGISNVLEDFSEWLIQDNNKCLECGAIKNDKIVYGCEECIESRDRKKSL